MFSLKELFLEGEITDKNKKGRMVAIMVPPKVGSHMHSFFKDVSGEPVEPQDMHITLGLVHSGDNKVIYKTLKKAAKILKPFNIEVNDFDQFPPNEHNHGKHVLYAKPHCPILKSVHRLVLGLLKKQGVDIDNGSFGFKPHITLKYADIEPDIQRKARAKFKVDKIYLVVNNKKHGVKIGA